MAGEKPCYFNTNSVCVKTGVAEKYQLDGAVAGFKKLLASHPDKHIRTLANTEIEVNLVTRGPDNQSAKFGYLWVSNPEVYWILCGFNPDGSKRQELISDEEEEAEDLLDLDLDLSSMDLNAITEAHTKKEKPKVYKDLGPLIQFPAYKYTKEQAEMVHTYLTEQESQLAKSEGRDPMEIPRQEYGFFEVTRSCTMRIDDDKLADILRGEVPMWVTPSMVYKMFAKFAETEVPSVYETVTTLDKNKFKTETFNFKTSFFRIRFSYKPIRNRPDYKVVLVEYPYSSYGTGIFAIQMRRKTTFVNPNPTDGENPNVVCIFDFLRKGPVNAAADSSPAYSGGGRSGGGFSPRPSPNFNRFANGGAGASSSDDGFTAVMRRK